MACCLPFSAPGVLGNDFDVDGDTLLSLLTSVPTSGSVVMNNDGGFTYTPPMNWFGTATFEYAASDGQSLSTATVTIIVPPTSLSAAGRPPSAPQAASMNERRMASQRDGERCIGGSVR